MTNVTLWLNLQNQIVKWLCRMDFTAEFLETQWGDKLRKRRLIGVSRRDLDVDASVAAFSLYVCDINPSTTGNPFLGGNYLGISIGRFCWGDSKRVRFVCFICAVIS